MMNLGIDKSAKAFERAIKNVNEELEERHCKRVFIRLTKKLIISTKCIQALLSKRTSFQLI